jgi:hypothetical protein
MNGLLKRGKAEEVFASASKFPVDADFLISQLKERVK